MKNLLIFFILALSIIFGSCKNQKQIITTDLHETTDSIVKNDVEINNHVSDLLQSEINVVANETKTDFTEETTTVTEYSEPDSLGDQSILRTITRVTKNNIKIDRTIETEIVDSSKRESNSSYIEKSNIEFHNKIKTKTTTKEKSKLPIIILRTTIVIVILIMLGLRWKKIFPFD